MVLDSDMNSLSKMFRGIYYVNTDGGGLRFSHREWPNMGKLTKLVDGKKYNRNSKKRE